MLAFPKSDKITHCWGAYFKLTFSRTSLQWVKDQRESVSGIIFPGAFTSMIVFMIANGPLFLRML